LKKPFAQLSVAQPRKQLQSKNSLFPAFAGLFRTQEEPQTVSFKLPPSVAIGEPINIEVTPLDNPNKLHWVGMYNENQTQLTYEWVSAHKPGLIVFPPTRTLSSVSFQYFISRPSQSIAKTESIAITSPISIVPNVDLETNQVTIEIQNSSETTFPNMWVGLFHENGKQFDWKYNDKSAAKVIFALPKSSGKFLAKCFIEKSTDSVVASCDISVERS